MSRRRRAALLLGLALALGGLAASDVAQREAALDRRLGPFVPVIVVRSALREGEEIAPARLAVRRVPVKFAPPQAFPTPGALLGLRARAPLPAGSALTPAVVRDPDVAAAGLARPGERVAELVATGDPRLVVAGAHVDVLVTREGDGDRAGRTRLALQDVEVLDSRAAPADDHADAPSGVPRVSASVRVTLRQAVYLAAAQSFAREIRLLPRAPGDRGRTGAGIGTGAGLGG